MIDTQRPSRPRGAASRRRADNSGAGANHRSARSAPRLPIIAALAVMFVGGGAAAYLYWGPVADFVAWAWSTFHYTLGFLFVWTAAVALAATRRPTLLWNYPHVWAASLLLTLVVAGCLQLSGNGLGGALGGSVVGSSAAWGIVRTGAIFAVVIAAATPYVSYKVGRVALMAGGIAVYYGWTGLHTAGVWIGLRCTAASPRLAAAAGATRRAIAGAYRRFPVHTYVMTGCAIAVGFVAGLVTRKTARRNRTGAATTHAGARSALGDAPRVDPRLLTPVLAYRPSALTPPDAPTTRRPAPWSPKEVDESDEPTTWAPTEAADVNNPAPWSLAERAELNRPAPWTPAEPVDDVDEPAAPTAPTTPTAGAGFAYEFRSPFAADPALAGPDFDPDDPQPSDEDEIDDFLSAVEDDEEALDDEDEFSPGLEPVIIDMSSEDAHVSGSIGKSAVGWKLPPIDLLKDVPRTKVSDEVHQATARLIEQTLAEYGIEANVKEIRPGPVVTQYGIVPGWVRRYKDVRDRNEDGTPARGDDGKLLSRRVEEKTRVRVDHVLAREKDLSLALAAPSLRFEAPVPGESFMGLEVPNAQREVVTLRSSLESEAFQQLRQKAKLPVALGLGSGGEPVITDLADMPHLLIAGATGSGKSVCMNTIICSLMMQLTPMDMQMYLVDPKRVELTAYNGLPHLAGPVLVEVDEAVPALHALIAEMQSRYKRFELRGARNIQTFNRKLQKGEGPIPYLILVIDELADLMMTASGDVEYALCRLAQLGRATGIHLVVATQRPSVDVLTGLIKANFPSRLSFAVSSQVDSRTVLDSAGAEKLLGRGDLLFMPTNAVKPKRLQGAFISDEEVDAIVSFWANQRGGPKPAVQLDVAPPANDGDSMLQEAQKLALQHHRISASLLQRKLGVGYAKAASLLDHLEDLGIVGAGDPGKSREVITSGMEPPAPL